MPSRTIDPIQASGRLAIIAGRGQQPLDVERAARARGETPFIIRIKQHCAADFPHSEVVDFGIGQLAAAVDAMRQAGCSRLIMTGKVDRPPLNPLSLDSEALRLLGRVIFKGDDAALTIISGYFREKGFELLAQNHFLEGRQIEPGYHFGRTLSPDERQAISCGIDTLEALGRLDVGQSVMVQGHRVLAIEAAEGTDLMIDRAAELIEPQGGCVAFVKMSKSGQNPEQDPPGFGCMTAQKLASYGVTIIALEPVHVFLADELANIEELAASQSLIITSTDNTASLSGTDTEG